MSKSLASLVDQILSSALEELELRSFPLFTFAFYRDHESNAISVCADTEESSRRAVVSSNKFSYGYFREFVESGEMKRAALWQSNAGRSFSLGDFAAVNLSRRQLPSSFDEQALFLEMVRGVLKVQQRAALLSPQPEALALAVSGPDSEVQLVWCPGA